MYLPDAHPCGSNRCLVMLNYLLIIPTFSNTCHSAIQQKLETLVSVYVVYDERIKTHLSSNVGTFHNTLNRQ